MSDDRQPTLPDVINAAVDAGVRGLATLIPAKVVKWDASKQQADCQVLVQDSYEDEQGDRQVKSVPVIPGVPVQFIGAGGFRLTVPIENGTLGSLIFAHRSLDKWLSGSGGEVDPELDHDHALTDAVFFPGLMPFGAPWQDVPSGAISLGKDSGLQLKITSDAATIATTEANAQFVALSNKVKAELDKIVTTLGTGTANLGTGAVTFSTPYVAAAVAASKFKAE